MKNTFYTLALALCLGQSVSAIGEQPIPTDDEIRNYVETYLPQYEAGETQMREKAQKYPFSGATTKEDIALSEAVLKEPFAVSPSCTRKATEAALPITLHLVAEAHACPNCSLEELLLEKEAKGSPNRALLKEGKPALFSHLYGGDYISHATLKEWGHNVRGWECPSQSLYTDLMYGLRDIVESEKNGKGKATAWGLLRSVFNKIPPPLLLSLIEKLPNAVRGLEVTKCLKSIAQIRQNNKAIDPFAGGDSNRALNAAFKAENIEQILSVVHELFLTLYDHLPEIMHLEMPEMDPQLVQEIAVSFEHPSKNVFGIFKSRAIDAYRNRCGAKAMIDSVCQQLESKGSSVKVSLVAGGAHTSGMLHMLQETFSEINKDRRAHNADVIKIEEVDNYKKYTGMDVDTRIENANRIRVLLTPKP